MSFQKVIDKYSGLHLLTVKIDDVENQPNAFKSLANLGVKHNGGEGAYYGDMGAGAGGTQDEYMIRNKYPSG